MQNAPAGNAAAGGDAMWDMVTLAVLPPAAGADDERVAAARQRIDEYARARRMQVLNGLMSTQVSARRAAGEVHAAVRQRAGAARR